MHLLLIYTATIHVLTCTHAAAGSRRKTTTVPTQTQAQSTTPPTKSPISVASNTPSTSPLSSPSTYSITCLSSQHATCTPNNNNNPPTSTHSPTSRPYSLRVLGIAWMSQLDPTNSFPEIWVPSDQFWSVATIWPIAISHFNSRRDDIVPAFGQLGSCPVTIDLVKLADGVGSPPYSIRAWLSTTSQEIHAILGPVRTECAIPLATTLGVLQVPMVSHWVTSPALNDKSLYPYFTRTTPSDDAAAAMLAVAIKQMGYTRIGILHQNDPFGTAWANSLFASLNVFGITASIVPFDDTYGDQMRISMDDAVRRLADDGLNVIFFMYILDEAVFWVSLAAKHHNMVGPNHLWIHNIIDLNLLNDQFPQPENVTLVHNFMNASLQLRTFVPGEDNNQPNPGWTALINAWPTFNVTLVNSYLPTELLNGQSYQRSASYFNDSLATQFAVWSYTYDAAALLGLAACQAWQQGEDFTKGSVLLQHMLQLNFSGASGTVKLLPNGNRDPSTSVNVLYLIQDVNRTGSSLTAIPWALWAPGGGDSWNLSVLGESAYYWSDGSTKYPADTTIPVQDMNWLPTWCKAIGGIEIGIVCMFVIWAGLWMIQNRASAILIESQPAFMSLILVGATLLAAAIVPLTIENSDVACMAFPWLYALGLTLSVAPLGIKSWRVAVLWFNPGFSRRKGFGKFYIFGVLACVVIEVLILVGWSIQAPLIYVRVVMFEDNLGNPLSSYGICAFGVNQGAAAAYMGVLLGLNAVLVIFTGIVSYRVRDAPEKFHEAKFTAMAALSLCQVYLFGIPLVAAIYDNTVARFFVLSALCFLTAMALLCSLFVPKIVKLQRERSTSNKNSSGSSPKRPAVMVGGAGGGGGNNGGPHLPPPRTTDGKGIGGPDSLLHLLQNRNAGDQDVRSQARHYRSLGGGGGGGGETVEDLEPNSPELRVRKVRADGKDIVISQLGYASQGGDQQWNTAESDLTYQINTESAVLSTLDVGDGGDGGGGEVPDNEEQITKSVALI